MPDPFDFAEKLRYYVDRTAYTPGQLATLTDLPRTTIVNWLNGRVHRPRDWQPVVQLLAVLRLEEKEADEILNAANQPAIAELRLIATSEKERALLAAWERPNPSLAPTYRPPFQAVPDIPYFVGRQTVLAQLQKQLLDPTGPKISVLQGMAGSGKTAVAVRIAYQLRSRFSDGVLWARLDISNPMMILHTFAQAYGADVGQYDDIASRSRVVRDLLADKHALIVLDNSLDSAAVEPLLPPTGQCAVLITTRRHDLRVAQGASRISLNPFETGSETSRQLFAHFLGPERTVAEAELLEEMASYVGHLPLALAIAAGRLAYEPGWSTADFLGRLKQSSRRLKELQSEDQNVRLSFAASYDLLPDEVRPFFGSLSLFGGEDFSPAAAAAAARVTLEDAQDYLRMLFRLSLVQLGRAGRYQLHPLLRDYGRENLPEPMAWQPLADYYRDYISRYNLGDPALALESENISAVITGAQENGETTAATGLLLAFVPYLKMQGMYAAAQNQLDLSLNTAKEDQRLAILLHLAQIARYFRRYEEADEYLESAVPLAQNREDVFYQSAIEAEKGILAGCRTDYEGARHHFSQGLVLARKHNRPSMLIPLLKEMGAAEVAAGNYGAAERYYREGLGLAREDAPVYEPVLLRCLGGIALIRDQDTGRAEALYQEGLQKARLMNSREDIILLMNNLAAVAFRRGERAEARKLLSDGLAQARTLLHQVATAMILSNLGRLAMHEGQWKTAEEYLAEGLAVATTAAHHQMIAAMQRSLDILAERSLENLDLERLRIFYD